MTPLHNIRIMMGIALLTTSVTADNSFPYANFTFTGNELEIWTLDKVREHRDRSIGYFNENDSVMIKDDAAAEHLIAYKSSNKEGISDQALLENEKNGIIDPNAKIFKTELDLTKLNGSVNVAIHVDDIATLTVTEKLNGSEPTGYTPITETYHVNGTAFWNLDRSYKEFTTPIPAGRKYDLKLNYQNTANLTKKYNGPIDYDGLNVFLMHQPDFDLAIASYGNEPNLPEERQADGSTASKHHEMDPGAVVIAPIAGSNGENITPGKRARLTLTCDGSHAADGIYTLSSDPSLTKLKIYDKEEGGDPIPLPIFLSSSDFKSATKTYYVGSDAFSPEDKIEEDRLTFTYHRQDTAGDAEEELKDQVKVTLTPIEVIELAPLVNDEDGNPIPASSKPNWGRPLSPFVEEDPYKNRIAHRELKVRIGSPALKGKKVTWTLGELPGATPATIRGKWSDSPIKSHQNAFEESAAYGKNGFNILSGTGMETKAETTVSADGHTAIRVNVPPIGFNQVRIKIQVEGIDEPFNLIDMEVPAVIVIDPGHGGPEGPKEGGSSWNNATSFGVSPALSSEPQKKGESWEDYCARVGKTLEKDLTLLWGIELRAKIAAALSKSGHAHHQIMMTRSSDINPGISDRSQVARDNGADIFLSIHFNGSVDQSIHGPETWIEPDGANVNFTEDSNLAKRIQAALDAYIPNTQKPGKKGYRGIKEGTPSHVYRDYNLDNKNNKPPFIRACLAEMDWITNKEVETNLISGANASINRGAVLSGITVGIVEDIKNYK